MIGAFAGGTIVLLESLCYEWRSGPSVAAGVGGLPGCASDRASTESFCNKFDSSFVILGKYSSEFRTAHSNGASRSMKTCVEAFVELSEKEDGLIGKVVAFDAPWARVGCSSAFAHMKRLCDGRGCSAREDPPYLEELNSTFAEGFDVLHADSMRLVDLLATEESRFTYHRFTSDFDVDHLRNTAPLGACMIDLGDGFSRTAVLMLSSPSNESLVRLKVVVERVPFGVLESQRVREVFARDVVDRRVQTYRRHAWALDGSTSDSSLDVALGSTSCCIVRDGVSALLRMRAPESEQERNRMIQSLVRCANYDDINQVCAIDSLIKKLIQKRTSRCLQKVEVECVLFGGWFDTVDKDSIPLDEIDYLSQLCSGEKVAQLLRFAACAATLNTIGIDTFALSDFRSLSSYLSEDALRVHDVVTSTFLKDVVGVRPLGMEEEEENEEEGEGGFDGALEHSNLRLRMASLMTDYVCSNERIQGCEESSTIGAEDVLKQPFSDPELEVSSEGWSDFNASHDTWAETHLVWGHVGDVVLDSKVDSSRKLFELVSSVTEEVTGRRGRVSCSRLFEEALRSSSRSGVSCTNCTFEEASVLLGEDALEACRLLSVVLYERSTRLRKRPLDVVLVRSISWTKCIGACLLSYDDRENCTKITLLSPDMLMRLMLRNGSIAVSRSSWGRQDHWHVLHRSWEDISIPNSERVLNKLCDVVDDALALSTEPVVASSGDVFVGTTRKRVEHDGFRLDVDASDPDTVALEYVKRRRDNETMHEFVLRTSARVSQ